MMIADERFTDHKNSKKRRRVILEVIVIAVVAVIAVMALFTLKTYKPAAKYAAGPDKGFVALSYFGVERIGTQSMIGEDRLRKHLQALKDQGYVTVTQQDINDYYQTGKPLPDRALFLMFEDGRRDTAVFSQKILEDLNFKATMLTYPEKFEKKDTKFLMPDELKDLEKTSFWEMGTNGYRLYFINVFDRYDNYLGEMGPLKHAEVAPYLSRRYNHYLMDYIRDEDGIPKESYRRMKKRISADYEMLRDAYVEGIGYVPGTYVLMHSNTGSFGNNDKVSSVNSYWIQKLFNMNFNREGFCFNQRNSSIYDLTRMQPQAYWSVNHLLMRIKYDTHQDLDFVEGNAEKQKAWRLLKGASEIEDETMTLTSLPLDKGLVRLKNHTEVANMKVSVHLKGNKFGMQKIYVRADDNLNRYLAVSILNNVLYVTEKTGAVEQELLRLDLDEFDGKEPLSVPEDKKSAELHELKTFAKYADSAQQAKVYTERMKDKNLEDPQTIAEGAQQYLADLSVNAKGDRQLNFAVQGNTMQVKLDGKDVVRDLPVNDINAGTVYLESAWGGYGWNQRNLADDVYDGVFEQLVITENTGAADDKEQIIFDSHLRGMDNFKFKAEQLWEKLLDMFVGRWSVRKGGEK